MLYYSEDLRTLLLAQLLYKQIEEKVRFNVTNLYSCVASYIATLCCVLHAMCM